MTKRNFLIVIITCLYLDAKTQTCIYPGQTPVSAYLICGTVSIYQTTPTICGQTTVPVPCSDGATHQNTNPNFFRMACYASDTLGFSILPDESNANYDWQLFDISNTNPFDIFTNPALFVGCNWSSEPGETGASSDGTMLAVCAGSGQPLFSKMPNIIIGHTYLLMVCNQSGSAGGYQLTFDGGFALITDVNEPKILQTSLNCNATKILVRLTKLVSCSTIASDGSDFAISGGALITGAVPGNCSSSDGTDSITLSLNQPLTNGTYNLMVTTGSDGNTLVDICGLSITDGEIKPVIAGPLIPTPIDSIKPVACGPSYIDLVFKKPIRCSSIAADGSDFIISGPQTVTATVAPTNCNGNTNTAIIRLNLSSKLITAGSYTVKAKNGNDGNTLIDECGLLTPVGSSVSFTVRASVSAAFTYSVHSSCKTDTLYFSHKGNNGVSNWNWNFDNTSSSTLQYPVKYFSDTAKHTIKLIVSNGACSDTSVQNIKLTNRVTAAFVTPIAVCPGEMVQLINSSSGNIDSWNWDFGNGNSSNLATPPIQSFIPRNRETVYSIRLIVTNNLIGCKDTATHTIRAMKECFVMVPSAFTPDGDGKNDYLTPLNTNKADDLEFRVYNRAGQLVFISKNGNKKWDGKINGIRQDTGLYAWMLTYTQHDTGKKVFLKGVTLLLR